MIKTIFEQTQLQWNEKSEHPHWCGLNLYGVDGVVWRTPDTKENSDVFSRASNNETVGAYPQVRMVCQMELTSHMLINSAFDSLRSMK